MAFQVDKNGNIALIQGDSGSYCIEGLPTDKNYTVHFAIQDEKRKQIGTDITISANYASNIVIELTAELTDLLIVKPSENSAEYYFGVKICTEDGLEDTLLLGNSDIGDINTITVYPKKVEGV